MAINIGGTNVTGVNFNGTTLSEVWVCDTSNATCCKVFPDKMPVRMTLSFSTCNEGAVDFCSNYFCLCSVESDVAVNKDCGNTYPYTFCAPPRGSDSGAYSCTKVYDINDSYKFWVESKLIFQDTTTDTRKCFAVFCECMTFACLPSASRYPGNDWCAEVSLACIDFPNDMQYYIGLECFYGQPNTYNFTSSGPGPMSLAIKCSMLTPVCINSSNGFYYRGCTGKVYLDSTTSFTTPTISSPNTFDDSKLIKCVCICSRLLTPTRPAMYWKILVCKGGQLVCEHYLCTPMAKLSCVYYIDVDMPV